MANKDKKDKKGKKDKTDKKSRTRNALRKKQYILSREEKRKIVGCYRVRERIFHLQLVREFEILTDVRSKSLYNSSYL